MTRSGAAGRRVDGLAICPSAKGMVEKSALNKFSLGKR
jgi:hypothetical protein